MVRCVLTLRVVAGYCRRGEIIEVLGWEAGVFGIGAGRLLIMRAPVCGGGSSVNGDAAWEGRYLLVDML